MAIRAPELRERVRRQDLSDLDDRMLVLDFQAGNEHQAYGEIYRRYHALARHVCQRILVNPQDAEEATQETMLRVYQGLPRFNGRFAVQSWVARIARNVSLDALRSRARRPQAADRPLVEVDEAVREAALRDADLVADPEALFEQRLSGDQVKAVLAELPSHYRNVLILREFEGRSHEEIGEALGVTAPQAKALIHRAKRRFRRMWDRPTGQHRLRGIVPLLVLPLRAPAFLRRAFDNAEHWFTGAATAPAATATAASAASTVSTVSTVTIAERVTAAAVALLLTGSAAAGAVALSDQDWRTRAQPTASSQAEPPVMTESVRPHQDPRFLEVEKEKAVLIAMPSETADLVEPPLTEEASTATESAAVSESPPATESPSPTDESSEPPPAIPDAPAWAMALQILAAPSFSCGCGPMEKVSEPEVSGQAGHDLTFIQTVRGPVRNPFGHQPWGVRIKMFGDVEGSTATAGFSLYLDQGRRSYEYEAQAQGDVFTFERLDNGGMRYNFSGTYNLVDPEAGADAVEPQDMPALRHGTFALSVDFWSDGTTLYNAELWLAEAPEQA